MAKITDLTALTAPVDTDFMVVVDESTAVTKKMELQYLLVALDGDHLDVTYTPTYYTPAATPAEADDVDDLAAHLYGIDQKLVGLTYAAITSSTTFTSAQRYLDINTSGGAITGTLPSAATVGAGFHYIFKIIDATAAFTLATNGAETIDGADAFGMTNLNEVLEIISDGANWKIVRWELNRTLQRPKFTYVGNTSFTIGAFTMAVPGMDYSHVYTKTNVTFVMGANGTAHTTTGWHYIFIDKTAVDTQNTPLLDADCFYNHTTAPTWDSDYGVWTNAGGDVCIFAVLQNSASTLKKWYHDGGDLVAYDSDMTSTVFSPGNTTWGAVAGVSDYIPAFSLGGFAHICAWAVPGVVALTSGFMWIRRGDSTSTGNRVGFLQGATGDVRVTGTFWTGKYPMGTSKNALIDMRFDEADTDADGYINFLGYFLPGGM